MASEVMSLGAMRGDLSEVPFKYDDLYLVALPTAITCARMFVHHILTAWDFRHLIPEVERVTVQLVGGAVKATGIPDEFQPGRDEPRLNRLVLRLRQSNAHLHVEVWDTSQEPPLGSPPAGHQSGYFTLDAGGKVVWVEIPCATGGSKSL